MKALFYTAVVCLLLALAFPAWADLSRADAAAIVQREGGARVLSVDPADLQGRSVWRVKVLTLQGTVKVIYLENFASHPRSDQRSPGAGPVIDLGREASQAVQPSFTFAPAHRTPPDRGVPSDRRCPRHAAGRLAQTERGLSCDSHP